MGRTFAFTIFTLGCLLIIHRQNFTHIQKKYSPSQVNVEILKAPSNINEEIVDSNNYYRTGKYNISLAPIPKWNSQNPLGFLDILSRKKINGYLFTQYNLYKMQINFIDLGYGSFVQINYWAQDIGSIKVQEKIGFSLSEDINEPSLNLDINKKYFKMTVRQSLRVDKNNQSQTVTTFNISLIQKDIELYANYTHVKRDQQCITAVRNKIISHKCYGGYGYGRIKVEQAYFDTQYGQKRTKLSAYNPKTNQTKCSFDGLRGSGWNWKWVWAYGTGFSKPEFYAKNHTIEKQRWIGFNFGSLYNKSEDFLFLNGKIYPMEGVQYTIDKQFPLKQNITFTVENPKINMNFLVMDKNVFYQDMGVLKNDMVKAQGHWAGYIIDPENTTNKIEFYQMSGIIQTANSIF